MCCCRTPLHVVEYFGSYCRLHISCGQSIWATLWSTALSLLYGKKSLVLMCERKFVMIQEQPRSILCPLPLHNPSKPFQAPHSLLSKPDMHTGNKLKEGVDLFLAQRKRKQIIAAYIGSRWGRGNGCKRFGVSNVLNLLPSWSPCCLPLVQLASGGLFDGPTVA